MKTYYVVTQGCYSDYHICAVTEDKERAEHLRLFFSEPNCQAEIEEYNDAVDETFDGDNSDSVYPWHVHIRKYLNECDAYQNEETAEQYRYEDDDPFEPEFDYQVINEDYRKYGYVYEPRILFDAYILADDKEHALKIARDEFATRYAQTMGVS